MSGVEVKMSVKDIANLALVGQSLSVAAAGFPKKSKSKKGELKNIIGSGTNVIIGSSILRASASNIGML